MTKIRSKLTRANVIPTLVLSVVLAAAAAFAAPTLAVSTGPTTGGNRAADKPIVANLEEAIPEAEQIFASCPEADAIPIEPSPPPEPTPSGPGYQCEFRFDLNGTVVKGQDEVVEYPLHTGTYMLVNYAPLSRAPDTFQRCVYEKHPESRDFNRHPVFLRGSACGYRSLGAVYAIEAKAYKLRSNDFIPKLLPSHFAVGDEGEVEVDFQVERFKCQAKTKPIGRSRVLQTATCLTRFGDAIKLTFDTPAPPRHR